jgi:hypothetical protein
VILAFAVPGVSEDELAAGLAVLCEVIGQPADQSQFRTKQSIDA